MRHPHLRVLVAVAGCALLVTVLVPAGDPPARPARPNVLLVTVDTLRADRMSGYGYERPTTPRLDAWMARGVRFTQARTIEPLTAPALTSLLTSTEPQDHGASRNGLRMRAGLASLPKTLQAHGYATAALVGNWTLRQKLTGLGEHFERYDELLTRKRWFGLVIGEADGNDITDAAIAWIDGQRAAPAAAAAAAQPFFLWVHYVEPHAPYVLHPEHRARLGLPATGDLSREDRYDTEVAFVDAAVGRLLEYIERRGLASDTLVVFAADHGESLGEHGYWGHGRNLYEPGLRIPLALGGPGRIRPRVLDAPALLTDVAPTILGLVGIAPPPSFRGFDWTPVLDGEPPPATRVTRYQAHRGVVLSNRRSELIRRSGLLEVGTIRGTVKEIFHVREQRRERYDLATDPAEALSLDAPKSRPSEDVLGWMATVYAGLEQFDDRSPEPLDEDAQARMRSLGYVD